MHIRSAGNGPITPDDYARWLGEEPDPLDLCDDCKSPNPFARNRLLPVLPDAGDAEWRAVLHSDRVTLLCLLTLDRFPLKETVHKYNALA